MPIGIYQHKPHQGFQKGHPDFVTKEGRKKTSQKMKVIMGSDKMRKRVSERVKGSGNPMYNVHKFGLDHPFYGKKHSIESRKKMSEKLKVTTPWNKGKKVGKGSYTSFKKGVIPWNKGLRGFMAGEKNHFWKGGITPINQKVRTSSDYKLWRKAVFERDNYTCQQCKQVGGILNADHIQPFAYFPELRFEISNGRTLCVGCHKKTNTYAHKTIKLQVA